MSTTTQVQRKRPHRLTLRLSTEELRHIREQADIANLRPARFARELCMGACLRPVPRFPKEVYRAVRSFGNNLNQLARQANMGEAYQGAVDALRRSVEELLKALHRGPCQS